jgi:hypothetical protein
VIKNLKDLCLQSYCSGREEWLRLANDGPPLMELRNIGVMTCRGRNVNV